MSVTFSAYQREQHPTFGEVWSPIEDGPTVNVSSTNASRLLGLLGLDPVEDVWDYPPLPAGDFHGRVLLALAVQPEDAGSPAYEERSPGGMVWVECGRREDYDQDLLGQLREIAEFAVSTGASVAWG